MSVRNEYAKLPYLFDHYRRLGVDRFFVIDNGSTDGTRAFLLSQKDTHVWTTTESFKKAKFGSKWFEILLKKYGTDHWCLIADADEVFVYPDYEHVTLHQLAYFLEQEGSTALKYYL
jgi:glycosyltransferase involved in cell wall biosynthesis